MTTSERFYEFKDTISGSDEAKPESIVLMLKFDLDHVAEVIKTEQGSCHIRRMLGISERFNTTILKHVMANFTEVMTHKHSYKVALRVLEVCNPTQKSNFCNLMLRDALLLARDGYGCTALKQVITLAEDRFKDEFIDLIARNSISLSPNSLGYSVIQHALSNYTSKETTRLHELVAEFNETITRSDITKLHKLVLMLTSDSDEFLNFIKTREGSLIIHIILGKSEEIDTIFLVAMKRRFPDVVSQNFGYNILLRIIHVFFQRDNFKVYLEIRKLISMVGFNKHNKIGGARIESTILDMNCTKYRLHRPYMELSFEKYGSHFVEQLLVDDAESWMMASDFVVEEIVEYIDEYTLVRLANDEYGNKVLKKILEAAKERRVDLFGNLAEKLKPFHGWLCGPRGENIAAIITDMATQTNKELFVGGLAKVFKEQFQVDVRLKAGSGGRRGAAISAHKIILCARSEVFKKMLESDDLCKTSNKLETITLPELKHTELEALAEFIYSDGSILSTKAKEHVRSLYVAADKYEIPHLRDLCRTELISSLNSLNALDALELAQIPFDKALNDAAFAFVKTNINKISSSAEFSVFVANNPNLTVEIVKATQPRSGYCACGRRCAYNCRNF